MIETVYWIWGICNIGKLDCHRSTSNSKIILAQQAVETIMVTKLKDRFSRDNAHVKSVSHKMTIFLLDMC